MNQAPDPAYNEDASARAFPTPSATGSNARESWQMVEDRVWSRRRAQTRQFRAHAELAYWVQQRNGGGLPSEVREPDALAERTVELAGEIGIPEARLRDVLKFLSAKRVDMARARLEGARAVISRLERRPDRRGVLRPQRIWFYQAANA